MKKKDKKVAWTLYSELVVDRIRHGNANSDLSWSHGLQSITMDIHTALIYMTPFGELYEMCISFLKECVAPVYKANESESAYYAMLIKLDSFILDLGRFIKSKPPLLIAAERIDKGQVVCITKKGMVKKR